MVRSKDLTVEKLKTGATRADYTEWAFEIEMFWESHNEWSGASEIMQKFRNT